MRKVLRSAVPALVVAAACSGSTTGGPSVGADQACSDAAGAICGKIEACAPFYVQLAYGDSATCASRLALSCADALSANGTGLTPSAMESCAKAVPSASCTDALGHNLPPACQAVAGQLTNGAACGDSSQCQSAFCNKAAGNTCGACAAKPSAGATCSADGDCPVGEICKSGGCVAPGAAGAQCDATQHPCNPTLVCKNGTCATPDEAGSPCTSTQGDTIGSCDELAGSYCDPRTKTCTKIALAQPGQPCGYVNGTLALCASGSCSLRGTTGTCQATPADGATCSASANPSCLPPAVCENQVCTLPNASTCH